MACCRGLRWSRWLSSTAERQKTGWPSCVIDTVLRIHYLLLWVDLSALAMEESLHHMLVFRDFAKLNESSARLAIDAPGTSQSARIKARFPSTATSLPLRCLTRDPS